MEQFYHASQLDLDKISPELLIERPLHAEERKAGYPVSRCPQSLENIILFSK